MNIDFRFYWSLFLRRFPVMALFVLVCAGLGAITAFKLPETFSTAARLVVEQAQIDPNTVTSTVQTDAVEQLDIIEQRLLTRANLIDIANRVGVFEDIRAMSPDIVVDEMKKATRIQRSAGREQATLMTIGFEARTGRIAQAVVNEYVTLVLKANVDSRMSRAENTLDFFTEEVRRIGQELDQQSAKIVAFKTANAAALPEDQAYRLTRQTLLQERLSRLERDQSTATAQRRDIVAIYNSTGSVSPENGGMSIRRSPQEEQLIALRAQLQALRADYTDTNPRVIRLQNQVDQLEAVVAAQVAADSPGEEGETSPEAAILAATLSQIDTRITEMDQEIAATTTEVDQLAKDISASSANGIQLSALDRDFQAAQARYEAATQNLNRARLGERIETTAQGQRITVIENANVPSEPNGPSRIKVALMGLGIGLAAAGGWFLLLEVLNRAIRRPAEVQSRFGITPIAAIPYMESRRHRFLRRSGLVGATLIVVIGVPVALWSIDQYYLPLDIVVQKGLDKMGIG